VIRPQRFLMDITMTLELRLNLDDGETRIDGLPESHEVNSIYKDSNSILYLVTHQQMDDDSQGSLGNTVEQPAGVCSKIYHTLFSGGPKERTRQEIFDARVEAMAAELANPGKGYDLFVGNAGEILTHAEVTFFDMLRDVKVNIFINFNII